ncbi:serpin family protein [Nanoarchaeota archaeon]
MIKKILAFGLIILSLFLFSCEEEPEPLPVDVSQATPEGVKTVVDANNQFALDYYNQIKGGDGNIFFSPYSISTALAMTYEGARGDTAKEMASVFYFPKGDTIRRSSYAKIYSDINKKDKSYKLHTANALWAEQTYKFLDNYLSTVETYYGGKTTNLDFKTKSEESRVTINKWVEDQTNNKIKDLIPSGVLTPITRLVLTNAIYFKGTWFKEFDKKDTSDQEFRTPEKNIMIPLMSQTGKEAEFLYTETEDTQILELPYDGEELSMLFFLPKDNDLDRLENDLSLEKIEEWKQNLNEQRVDIFIPKFKFETKYRMADDLKLMGMPLAFTPFQADFSGMDGGDLLYISEVIHQAFVEVNEEGTEAAAATAVVMALASAMPQSTPVFRADHPFIFIIQDKVHGNILFMGRVEDPS